MESLSEETGENLEICTNDSSSTLSLTSPISPGNATSNRWINKLLRKTKRAKKENELITKDLVHKSKIPVLKSKNKNSSIKNLFFHKIISNQETENNLEISYSVGKITSNKNSLQKLSASCTKIDLTTPENPIKNVDDFGLNNFYQISKLTQFIPKKLSFSSLRELNQISDQIRDSETYIIQVMAKYIKNPNLVQNLLDCFSKHANLSLDAEQRVQKLAHEVWLQQSEVMKHREFTLQSNLSSLTKVNRKLQSEMEVLAQKNENLGITTISQFPNSDLGNQLMETLSKNNEKLRQKTKTLLIEIEEQDKRLLSLQEENQSMEHQLLNVNSQLFNFKNVVQRIQHQNDLNNSNLSHQLQTNQDVVVECVKTADLLWSSLEEDIRKKCNLNWSNLKDRERSLPDLMSFCQNTIDDLVTQLASVKREIESVRNANSELSNKMKLAEESLSKSEMERSFCLSNVKSSNESFDFYLTKCKNYKEELEEINEKLRRSSEELEREKVKNENLTAEMEGSKKQSIEKNEELIFNKEKMSEYKCENDSLRMQLHGLKQVLETAGSGDVARELADTHEKMTCFQSQYYQMLSEKNFLVEQLQTANVDRETFNQYQNMYYQFIQAQQKELETSNDENMKLKRELESKTGKILTLQTQETKLLDEKNIMRQIYQQLKSEISRVQQLEGAVAGINLEASKLAIIAEFNKQLGEKLQCEVCEKDEKITELECSVLELNNAQIENTKDKVALCVELNEVFNINNQLNNSLLLEQEKIANLDEFKRSLEKSVSTQMQAVEQMQKTERTALKELLQDYKCVVVQRDNYHNEVEEYKKIISELKAKFLFQSKKLESTNKKCLEQQQMVDDLAKHLKDFEEELKLGNQEKVKLENLSNLLNKQLDEKTLKNQTLESSQTYLQTNAQKLHYELNDARKLKVEMEARLCKQIELNEKYETLHKQLEAISDQVSSENEELTQKVLDLQEAYKNLEAEHKTEAKNALDAGEAVKILTEKVEVLSKNLEEAVKQHQEIIAQKDLELLEAEDYCASLQMELKQAEFTAEDIDIQSKLLSESSVEQLQLKKMVLDLQRKEGEYEEVIESLNIEKSQLEEELNMCVENADSDCANYVHEMENLVRDYGDKKREMRLAIESLSENFAEIEKRYLAEREEHLKLIEAHKDLATKLLKAIRLLIEEKLHCQQLELNLEGHSKQNLVLTSEKNSAEKMIQLLSSELDEVKQRLEEASCDKQNLQKVLLDLQDMYKRTQSNEKRSGKSVVYSSACSSKASMTGEGENVEDRTKQLKDELEETHRTILTLKAEISSLNQQLTILEFQKCEVSLRLHESLQKLKNEGNMKEQLVKTHQDLLGTILKLDQETAISKTACEMLLTLIQGGS